MKRGIYIMWLMLLGVAAFAQTGREFWFSIPYVDKSHDTDLQADGVTLLSPSDNTASKVINYFRISTGEIGAIVTFYKYTGGVQSVLYTATVGSNSMTSVSVGNVGAPNISLSAFVIDVQNTILDRGIFISSTAPISIYYEIGSPNNTELFTLKGKDALGTEFYPVLQNAFSNKNIHTGWCANWALDSWTTLDILASEDNTVVTIDRPTAYVNQTDVAVSNYDYYKVTKTCQSNTILKRFASPANGCAFDDFHRVSETHTLYTEVRYEKRDVLAGGTVISTTTNPKVWDAITTNPLYDIMTPGTAKIFNEWWSNCGATPVTPPSFESQFTLGYTTMGCSEVSTLDSNRQVWTHTPLSYTGSSVTTVTLQKGNVYSIIAESQNAVKLFGGTKITATKPIGVVMKDDGVFDGSCGGSMSADLVGDQIVPTSKSGSAYIIPDLYEKITGAEPAQDEFLFIRALADGTQISIAGETNPVAILNKGDVFRYSNFSQNNGYKVVTSNNKLFECYHLGGLPSNQTDVTEFAGALVPPVDSCTGSTITAFVRPENTTFRPVLISRTNTAGSFKYFKQGDATWTSFTPTFTAIDINSDGSTDWYYACDANVGLGTPTDGVNYLIKNSEATFHFGFLQKRQTGTSHGCFYGYFSDFTAPDLLVGFAFTDIDPTAAVDMRVQLSAVGAKEGTYDWDLVSPTPATGSCDDSYFPNVANCDKSNPITLSAAIKAITGSFKYKCTGDNTCKAGKLTSYVTFDMVASVATLPVELYYFKAHCISMGTMLEWASLSEYENKEFTLYRSFDGKHFEAIAQFAGQGTTALKTYYSFIDSTAGTRDAYYKLLQTDFDGTQHQSKTISLLCNQAICGSIYPTLCHEGEQITIVCENKGTRMLRIVSMTGSVQLEKKLDSAQSSNTITLTITRGMYILQLLENNEIVSQQQIMIW